MSDALQYNGQVQGHEPLEVGLATDHGYLYYGTISKVDPAGFFIFIQVFVSRGFELGRNVNSEESTVSPEGS